ncbi:hypothetical protein IQ250_00300 [Pseudanabaenaceae cyanobacterium LEGE 13415]|nr:hypothetical protein [Pseudanabaenaceae cyanobacterium LEGE 13415]
MVAIALTLTNQIQQLTTLVLQSLSTVNNPLDQLQTLLAARNIPLNLDAIEVQIRNLLAAGLNWALTSLFRALAQR